jgi:[acyl-carrier-protein] S-malonyltransferase
MSASRLAFVFPGQGSQSLGMLDAVPAPEDLDRLIDAAEALSGLPLRTIAAEGPAERLADTRASQPLLYLAGLGWARALEAVGLEPALVAGHSLGELAALAYADVFSAEAGLQLVCERARLMAMVGESTPGSMAAVIGMEPATVCAVVDDLRDVWVANENAPAQTIISGTHPGIEAATRALSEAGARRVIPLRVSGPFHSPLMAPARDAFAAILAETQFRDARVPVVQNTDPSPTTEADVIRARLMEQIVSPVRWTETLAALAAAGVELVVEAGPGAVLSGLTRQWPGLAAISADSDGLERVLEVVGS